MTDNHQDDPPLEPSGIAQFVKHDRCPRYLKQRVEPDNEADARDWREAFGLMNIALLGNGRTFEATQVEALAANATKLIGPELEKTERDGIPSISVDETWADSPRGRTAQLRKAVEEAEQLPTGTDDTPYILCYQVPLGGQLGNEEIWGEADCLALAPADAVPGEPTQSPTTQSDSADADVTARVFDIKSASEEQPAHRVQVAIYSSLLEQTLGEAPTVPYRIETSVLTKATAAAPGTTHNPFTLPTFRRAEWELFTEQLLATDGAVDEALSDDLADLPFTLNQVCDNCSYKEACTTRAVEDPTDLASLAVLGLDANVQQALHNAGITNLRELSTVRPRLENPRPTDKPPALTLDPATRRTLEEALPGPIHETVQRAQALRGELDPEYPTTTRPQAIPGKDWVPLPDDRRDGWSNIDDADAGELIHVALFVRPDSTIDRIAALGACIHAGAHEEYVTIGEVIDAVPDDPTTATDAERELFDRFLGQLFDAIERVATDVGDPTQTGIHCYTYTNYETETLAEGLDRHVDTLRQARAMRNLLSLHAEGHTSVDQDMCSAVQPILHEHFALKYPAQGLLTMAEQFVHGWTIEALDPLDARPEEPPLRVIFREQFLNHRVPYLAAEPGIRVHLARGPLAEGPAADAADTDAESPAPDGWYPLRRRAGGQFPIEYIWATTPNHPDDDAPRLTPAIVDEWAVDADNEPLYKQEISRFYYRTPGGDDPIQQADVAYLVERLSYALCRLVEAVPYKDLYHEKTPIDATALDSFDLPVTDLPAAARDYLRMEHGTRRDETLTQYRQTCRERARTGRSIPIRCTDYEVDDDGLLTIMGRLAYDALFDDETTARQVASQCRVQPSDGPGGGSWRVLTGLETPATTTTGASPRDALSTTVANPTALQHSPPVLVERLDQQAGMITLTAFPHRFRRHGSEFRVDHCGWACPAGSNVDDPETPPADRDGYIADRPPVWVDTGNLFMLDPMVDDLGAPKADRALAPDTVSENVLWQQLQATQSSPATTRTPTAAVATEIKTFLDSMDDSEQLLSPNAAQRRFIGAVDSPIVTLQGPPGTGKTSGATAPALLARATARAHHDDSFVGIVVAPSHEAVDATLAGVVELCADWQAAPDEFDTLDLLRVLPSAPPTPGKRIDATTAAVDVEYCSYHADEGVDRLQTLAADTLAETATASQCLLFATPATLYKTLGIVAETLDVIDGTSAPAAMRYEPGLADVVCLDEASMCDLPRLLLAGSVLKPSGQTLLVGDHRQLPTVTQHDWTATLRTPLEATQAHRCALEYIQWRTDSTETDALHSGAGQPDGGLTQTRLLQFGASHGDETHTGGDTQ